ncbi:hypothetical protein [Kitasatospora terrestris]|uniref:hypothetical protein n=1 Tax=Kitasatospora terrestris TaxID=258051 RepID=UPI0031EC4A83
MTTTSDHTDPFAEAVGDAVETAAMAVRLLLSVADAVRLAAEARAHRSTPSSPAAQAVAEAAGDLRAHLPPDIVTALVRGAEWPRTAQQLVALRGAGVDLETFLPEVGQVAAGVRDEVLAKAALRRGTSPEGPWASLLRDAFPDDAVRDAILASQTWPEIASTMQLLHERGVDVHRLLAAAHRAGAVVDQAVARVPAYGSALPRTVSRDALRSYGPLTVGLDVPLDLDLGNRERALAQLGVSKAQNSRYVRWAHEAVPGMERTISLLVTTRQWPLIAARMARLEDHGADPRTHLAHLNRDRSWADGPTPGLGERLLRAACAALHRPAGEHPAPPAVIPAAARATSPSAHESTSPKKPSATSNHTAAYRERKAQASRATRNR